MGASPIDWVSFLGYPTLDNGVMVNDGWITQTVIIQPSYYLLIELIDSDIPLINCVT